MGNVIENLPLAPVPGWEEPEPDEQALLDGFAAQWARDRQVWAASHQQNLDRLAGGSISLQWMNTDGSHWGTRVKASPRGLTYDDINRPKCYGTIPEKSEWCNMTPRGSVREPYKDRLPVWSGYRLTEKWDLWADNVCSLYEEAKFRQWNATRDMAGSVEDIDMGMDGVAFLWGVIREEYLQRCDRAGFDRRERCTLYEDLPWKVA
jgi:hypothetical protein